MMKDGEERREEREMKENSKRSERSGSSYLMKAGTALLPSMISALGSSSSSF